MISRQGASGYRSSTVRYNAASLATSIYSLPNVFRHKRSSCVILPFLNPRPPFNPLHGKELFHELFTLRHQILYPVAIHPTPHPPAHPSLLCHLFPQLLPPLPTMEKESS